MITLKHALDSATARLAAASFYPRRDAEMLLMHLLGCDLAVLLTHPDRPLSTSDTARYDSLVERRRQAEPMQYILGAQEFFGLSFRVTADVLIPRPETEHLVEALLEHVDARVDREAPPRQASLAGDPGSQVRIADVGTGSGAIAVVLAHLLPQSQVTALDLSPAAIAIARGNAERHGVAGRVRFLESDLLAAVEGETFDAIVANPPYIADEEVLERQVREYEPHSALYAGPTGLEIYERLIPQAHKLLRPGGWLMLEIGHGQRPALLRLLSDWAEVGFREDLQGIPRVAIARR